MLKRDNLLLGIILGLFTPVLAFFLYYLLGFMPKHNESLAEFVNLIKQNRQTLPKLISVCLLLNGLVFYFYTRSRKDITAKGIFLVTMLYAITIIFLKVLHG